MGKEGAADILQHHLFNFWSWGCDETIKTSVLILCEETHTLDKFCLVECFHPALRQLNGTCHCQLSGHEMFLEGKSFSTLEMTRFGHLFFTRKS